MNTDLPVVFQSHEALLRRLAQVWDEGFLTGYQKVPGEVTPNPYRPEVSA